MNGPGRSPGCGPDLAGGPIASAASLMQSGRAGRLLGGGAGLALGLLALAHPLFVQPLPDLLLALASGHIGSPRSLEVSTARAEVFSREGGSYRRAGASSTNSARIAPWSL